MNFSKYQKYSIIAIADFVSILVAGFVAYLLLEIYVGLTVSMTLSLSIIYFITYILASLWTKNYNLIIRYMSFKGASDLLITHCIASILTLASAAIIYRSFSIRFVFLLTVFAIGLTFVSRASWRLTMDRRGNRPNGERVYEPTLLVGAGRGGNTFLKQFKNDGAYRFVGFVDDDKELLHKKLDNLSILGCIKDIPSIIEQYHLQNIIITAPTLPSEEIEQILDWGIEYDVDVRQMPSVEKTLLGYQMDTVSGPKEISISDLLGRDEVELDDSDALRQISGKDILVTGAGGSIGSEICRQLAKFAPKTIYLLGHGENSIYLINQEFAQKDLPNTRIIPIIADVQDKEHIEQIMQTYKPDIVYHAAAHKHVPLMEANPTEAVKNNVFGTLNVATAAKNANVDVFVMVSTDKANNPPNVMGASKRIAEMLVTGMDKVSNHTKFAAVRFGNVLGSRGSVIPVFKKQIEKGGPVTVTDFRMRRYFMTIPEASRLVIQAGSKAEGGELFILDMGKEVLILDLAKKMIKLSGFTEKEIPIVESGIRPGEKLYEELLLTDETTGQKVDDKIFVGKITSQPIEEIYEFVESLDLTAVNDDTLNKKLVDFVHRDAKTSENG
ncbi:MAG: polysaccharide biosynthesis protein [Aerococcus urinaeequi]|nr:polysaccharide biosynthesis protein [Aerococcus urinaeequi]